jgi:hypothetical protein
LQRAACETFKQHRLQMPDVAGLDWIDQRPTGVDQTGLREQSPEISKNWIIRFSD